ncbi:hypothetical protein BH09BAC1_BH09BAC1_31030 [soil metagenome]
MLFLAGAVWANAQQQLDDLFKAQTATQDLLLREARQFYANGSFKKASKIINKELKQHPDYFNGYVMMGFMFYERQEFETGALYFAKAVKLDPQHTGALFMRGNCFLKGGKYRIALKDYMQCLKLNSDFYPAYNNIAVVRLLYQDIENTSAFDLHLAKQDLDEVLVLGENAPDKAITFNMGFIYMLLWEFDQSIPFFDNAIEQDAGFAKAWFYRGLANYYNKHYVEAKTDFAVAQQLGFQTERCMAFVERLDKILNYLALQRPAKPEGW